MLPLVQILIRFIHFQLAWRSESTKGSSHALIFTLQEFGVDEQLQGQEEHHQEDAGHQDAVEAGAEQADLPEGHAATAAGLQPVGPAGKANVHAFHQSRFTHTHTHARTPSPGQPVFEAPTHGQQGAAV